MFRWKDISPDTLRAHWSAQTVREGCIAAVAIALCLLGGKLSGHEAAGAIAAGGAFTVGFAVFYPALRSPLISMTLATLGIASATFAGSLSAKWTVAVLIVVAVGGLNYGLLSGLGVTAGWIGQQSGVYLVIATYFPNGPKFAAGRASMLLLGGLLQVAIHAAFRFRQEPSMGLRFWAVAELRLREYMGSLSEHMMWGSETLAYAVKMVATMVLATAIYRKMHWANGYWVPMTALLVLKPQWTGTVSRSFARVSGTVTGAAIALGLAHIPHFPYWLIAVLVVAAAFGCYALQAVNYALFSVVITLYIVFVFRFGGFSETAAAHLRLLNTALGGALALAIDGLWFATSRVVDIETQPRHPTDVNAGTAARHADL
jgi:hypothetical protein